MWLPYFAMITLRPRLESNQPTSTSNSCKFDSCNCDMRVMVILRNTMVDGSSANTVICLIPTHRLCSPPVMTTPTNWYMLSWSLGPRRQPRLPPHFITLYTLFGTGAFSCHDDHDGIVTWTMPVFRAAVHVHGCPRTSDKQAYFGNTAYFQLQLQDNHGLFPRHQSPRRLHATSNQTTQCRSKRGVCHVYHQTRAATQRQPYSRLTLCMRNPRGRTDTITLYRCVK
jgi:hypothetical protein